MIFGIQAKVSIADIGNYALSHINIRSQACDGGSS